MIRFFHCSDIHLCKDNPDLDKLGLGASRKDEIWEQLILLLEKANRQAMFLLIAGDLFDIKSQSLSSTQKLMDIFSSFPKLKIIFNSGNHDPYLENSFYNQVTLPNNVHYFDSDIISFFEFPDSKIRIYGNSWASYSYKGIEKFEDKLDKSYFNILMLHTQLEKINEIYMCYDKESIVKANFDYVALGHIHKPLKVEENMYYSGTLEAQKFSDYGQRGYLDISLSKKFLKVDFIPFSKREYRTIDLDLEKISLNNVLDYIKSFSDDRNFYRFVIKNSKIKEELKFLDLILDSIKDEFYYVDLIKE